MTCYHQENNTGGRRIIDDHFDFPGFRDCPSFCGVEIYKTRRGNMAVIATELPDNTGTSVTNAWPELADYIYQVFGALLDGPDDPVWIEHYLKRRHGPEMFDRVYLERNDGQQPRRGTFIMARHRHPWELTTRAQVERFIGGEVYLY